MKVLLLWIVLLAIYIALGLACALWVARRRRTGESHAGFSCGRAAGDPFSYPFGEMPIVPRERHLIAGDFRAWGIRKSTLTPSAAVAHQRKEDGGRSVPTVGTAVVLNFPDGAEHA